MKLLMEPKSIAFIGVSRQIGDGTNPIEELLSYGYKGTIYPVNPNADFVMGIKAYPSVRELPEIADLAVVLTPRQFVRSIIRDCLARGIKCIIVETGGFAEADEEGRLLQSEIVMQAWKKGARILGPNTFGIMNAFKRVATAFVRLKMEQTPIGCVCQSGLFFSGLPSLHPGKVIDLANASDISFSDCLEYYEQDSEVKVILLHCEEIKDGPRFIKTAQRVAMKKPIIALKSGVTAEGGHLVQSHSGSLAGKSEVYTALFRQCGLLAVDSLEEMNEVCASLVSLPPLSGNRLAILTYTMGGAVLLLDACQKWDLELANLSEATKDKLRHLHPEWLPVQNPLDLGLLVAIYPQRLEAFMQVMEATLQDDNIDAIIVIAPIIPPYLANYPVLASQLAQKYPGKPIVSWVHNSEMNRSLGFGVINFTSPDSLARALGHLWQFFSRR